MDWNNELLASVLWLGIAFVLSLTGLFLIAVALSRWTLWGRQFKGLAWPYFSPARSKTPLLMVTLIILLTLSTGQPTDKVSATETLSSIGYVKNLVILSCASSLR